MILPINQESIPRELKNLNNWLVWKSTPVEGRDKPTKVPYQTNGRKAASTIPETWTNFQNAYAAYKTGHYDGIGFALTPETPIGIDLDHCRCPAFPNIEIIAPWAMDIIKDVNSYTEASPSGKGIRIFANGGKLPAGGRKKGDFEIYQSGRYLTVTGDHIKGTPKEIMNRPDILDAVFSEIFGKDKDAEEKTQLRSNMGVTDILEKAFASKSGEKIRKLYNGDHSDYPSPSEADLSLCSHLAFWFGNDAAMIDTAFRASGLYRPKWDKKHHANGSTYGQWTIRKAIEGNQETYTGGCEHGAHATQSESWEEPVLFGSMDTPEISAGILPGFLGEYCAAVSEATQTPPALAVAMGLSVIATCIQKRFEVSPYEGYTEPTNIWTCSGSDPGTRKTAVKTALTLPLTHWEKEEADAMKTDLLRVKHTRDINLKRIDQLRAKAAKPETEAAVRENCMREIMSIENDTPEELLSPRLWTDDVTPERLQGLLCDHGERMSLISDEGGTFEVMAGLYNNGRSNVNVYLQAHAGAETRVDRQGRLVILHQPALTFGLTVQPQVIADLVQGNKARFRGNGMLARFLYFMPKSNVGHRDVTRHTSVPESIKAAYNDGIFKLLYIPPVFDEYGQERARILTLNPDALSAWMQFSAYIESKQGEDGEYHSIRDWTSKLPGAALRIAGIFHLVEHGEQTPIISKDTIGKALDLSELLISHARAAFDLMGSEQAVNDAKIVFTWLRSLPGDHFTQREALKKHEGRFKRLERLKKGLDVLTERHIISTPQTTATGDKGGRPGIYYLINPAIRGGGSHGMA
jgi:putative DNA primase/helicase